MLMDLKDNEIVEKNKSFVHSFKYAFEGVCTVFKDERNMRFHVLAAILAIIAGCIFKLHMGEWISLAICIFLVLVMEILNTVIENVVDLVTEKRRHPLAKKAKDMAAAAVLLTSFLALIVGAMIFVPKVLALIL